MPGAVGDGFSEGYVLVQMEGSDEGLELPVEVASHIFPRAPRRRPDPGHPVGESWVRQVLRDLSATFG